MERTEAIEISEQEAPQEEQKPSLLVSWFRSQFVSVTATGVDFAVTILLTEIIKTWYVASNVAGAIAGGIVSFTLCRVWAFNRRSQVWHLQALRYVLAIALSLTLNTLLVWALTESLHISYIFSKIMAAAAVGLTVNFLVFRYFVFK